MSALDRADRARDEEAWPEAAKAYLAHLATNPDHWAIWVQQGHASKELGDRETATESYARAIAISADPDPIRHQAHLLLQMGRDAQAEQHFRMLFGTPFEAEARDVLQSMTARTLKGAEAKLSPPSPAAKAVPGRAKSAANHRLVHEAVEMRLESAEPNRIKGWVVSRTDPGARLRLAVEIDGTPYLECLNTVSRGDLKRAGKSAGEGGFDIAIPPGMLPPGRREVGLRALDYDAVLTAEVSVSDEAAPAISPSKGQDVAVVVPIYNAFDDLEVCLQRLRLHTRAPAHLILIDDCSSDPRVGELLSRASSWPNTIVLRNARNLGFTRTVNRGLKAARRRDVVILNSDARVTPGWLDGLRQAASSDDRIGTVTAMSDRAGVFSAPRTDGDNDLPPGMSEVDFATAFRRRGQGLYPSVATGHGFCMYIRRSMLDEIGLLDEAAFPRGYGEENDLCMRGLRAGWRNIVDDRTYVFHDRSKSFGDAKTALLSHGRQVLDVRYPEYGKLARQIRDMPGMAVARFKALQALGDVKSGLRPRALFVVASETGGTPQTNRDLMAALSDRWEGWLFRCDTRRMVLSRLEGDALVEVRTHDLLEPIDPITFSSFEYERVIGSWLAELGFDLVHIRHLGWHSLRLPEIARRSGAATVMSFHDFHALCPTVKLLDDTMTFCGGRCTAGDGQCQPELWPVGAMPHLKHVWVHEWRSRYGRALADCDAFITTSPSARARIIEGLADVDPERFTVIPHGRDFAELQKLSADFEPGQPLRILIPGNINDAKGLSLIEALSALDVDGRLELHILGKVQRAVAGRNIFVHGAYKREDFARHVAEIRPHVGAVLSIWDETWCHTLTELWSVGLPAMTFDYPTVAGRVRRSGAGWVLKNETNAVRLLAEIVSRCTDEAKIAPKRRAVDKWQRSDGVRETTQVMADRYHVVYQAARQRRQAADAPFGLTEADSPAQIA